MLNAICISSLSVAKGYDKSSNSTKKRGKEQNNKLE